ncbi:MAG: flagellar hook-basal body complex protein FliE [Phycisphaerales bacterium JB041]
MADPVGLIGAGGTGPVQRPVTGVGGLRPEADPNGPSFRDVFMDTLREADALQQDATKAIEDLATGQRDDPEGVILAAKKAETAFQMIQSLRNKVMQAYDEVKQMRV